MILMCCGINGYASQQVNEGRQQEENIIEGRILSTYQKLHRI